MRAHAVRVVGIAVVFAGALFLAAVGVSGPPEAAGPGDGEASAGLELSSADLRNAVMGLFALVALVVVMRYVEEEG